MATIINCGGGTMTNCPFPVGYGGFFQTDPNTLYSGTKWEQKKDVFILAAGATYPAGSTGGEAQHTLTEAEIPSHTHAYSPAPDVAVGITPNPSSGTWTYLMLEARTGYTAPTGGSQPHNNMPPYYSMPFWIRTA